MGRMVSSHFLIETSPSSAEYSIGTDLSQDPIVKLRGRHLMVCGRRVDVVDRG